MLVAALVAVGAMEWALISHDFSIRYVAENNARGTPFLYTITGLWAALEGSILLWALILGGYLAFVAHQFRHRAHRSARGVARRITGLVVALVLLRAHARAGQPVRDARDRVPLDGRGPEPAAAEPRAHGVPPADALPRATSGSRCRSCSRSRALVTGRFGEGWLADTRRATLVAWGFLTVGIILGAWWSYEVLGWGGFWAWDPVENASLLPWLTAPRSSTR